MPTPRKSPLPADPHLVRMSFGEHLEELRKRIVHALIGSIAGIALCMYYANNIVEYLLRPYRLALMAHHYPGVFSFTKPPEIIISYITIGFQAGLVLSSPWIIYQLWQFVASGLFPKERKIVYRYIGPSALLFLAGIAIFYFVVLPATLNFFVGFTDKTAAHPPHPTWIETHLHLFPTIDIANAPPGNNASPTTLPILNADPPKPPDGVGYLYYDASQGAIKFRAANDILILMTLQSSSLFANNPRFDDYLSFVTWTAITLGLAFELPMVMLILAQIGLLKVQTYRKSRKYAYFIILIVSILIAPSPDPFVPLLFLLPLLALYEAGILTATLVLRKKSHPSPNV